jgi:hypothetical protein
MPTEPKAGDERDWTDDVAERIDSYVGMVRDKTTVPATTIARGLVYGLVVAVLAAALLILLLIAGIRLLDVYLPFHPIGRRVWVVDAAGAAIFLAAGTFCWRRRRPRSA